MKKLALALISLFVLSTSAMADVYITLGEQADLPHCGGTIRANNGSNDDQVNIVFKNVENCSNFDILSDNGGTISDYDKKKLQGENPNRSGSFTIPERFISSGHGRYLYNSITVIVKSNSGKHYDRVHVSFRSRQ